MSDSSSSSGMGVAGVLQIVFIVLKLVGTISWSWLWVLSPTWIWLATVLVLSTLLATIQYLIIRKR